MQTIYANIDKSAIEQMETEQFDGRIITITTKTETDKAVSYLQPFPVVGIDTETRPSFSKHESHKVCLLQISTPDTCFLFRLNLTDIPDSLANLLADPNQIKVGLSLKDDIRALNARRKIMFSRYVELQNKVRDIGIQDKSLQKIYANIFGKKISKNKRLTNWEAPSLSEGQKRYAATDAWACLKIYNELEKLTVTREYIYVSPMNDLRMIDIWTDHVVKQTLAHLNPKNNLQTQTI
ncbi:MAG: 3'-5' exonuclease [Bacteroidaceae bacterium]|nr:3'-5' exonuclease [Bacteroidaceae bacterium]